MRVQFKYSRTIDGKAFAPGVHDVEDKMLDHWFFKGLVQSKHVICLDGPSSSLVMMEEEEKVVEAPEPEQPKEKTNRKKKSS